jgi:hypothetical protein
MRAVQDSLAGNQISRTCPMNSTNLSQPGEYSLPSNVVDCGQELNSVFLEDAPSREFLESFGTFLQVPCQVLFARFVKRTSTPLDG